MGPKRQKTKDPLVAEDEVSVGSVGSRSSARLKRKRASSSSHRVMAGKVLPFDAVREEDDEAEQEEKRRTSKRVKKHHVEPSIVGDAAQAKPLVDVEMTAADEEVDVEMEEDSKTRVRSMVVASKTVLSSTAAVAKATSASKIAASAAAAPHRPSVRPSEPRVVIVPPPPLPTTKPSPATTIKPQPVSTPAMKLARNTPHVPLQAPAVVARTEVPPEPELAPDVAVPPSATFWRTLCLDRTLGWLVLLLLLQLLLFPLWKQTIWTGTIALSNVLVSVVRWTDRTVHHPQEEIQQAMQTLDQLQGNLQELQQQEAAHWQQWQAALEQSEDFDAKEHQARRASLTALVQQLHEANEEDDVDALVDIVEAQKDDRPGPKLLHLAHLRRLLSKLLPPEHPPKRPDGTCGDDTAPLDVNTAEAVRAKLSAQIELLQRNDTTHPWHQRARLWVQRQVKQQVRRFQTALDKLELRQKHVGVGKDPNALLRALRRVIEQRFIMESSGGDHRIDYAAVQHGGRVVASSASLVDDLPLLNRLAAFWKLRFYGHGPAVALMPSGGTLGHCWSLAGTTGHLTVQLGRAVPVQSVVVEHVAAGVVAPSAPRALRVYGYATADDVAASNDDTPGGGSFLGSFEYDHAKAKDGRMEFPVKQTGAPLQYVRLYIDSNWGNPDNYTCLYRFRVHGPPIEL